MNIAIIGACETGKAYAAAFAFAGHNIYMAWKDGDKPDINPILQAADNIHFCSIEEAAGVADLIFIATPPKDVREVAYWLGDVRRKVIIDASANIFVPNEENIKTACAIKAITGSAHVIKIFNAKGYEDVLKPIFKSQKIDLLLAGDSKKAKEIMKILALELDMKDCYDFGDGNAIPLFDEMAKCWRNVVAVHAPKLTPLVRVI
jgi:predicted dinucleotide-binding enzyme